MMRYVERMVRWRSFCTSFMECSEDYKKDPDDIKTRITEDQIVEARTQYYQEKLVDAMLKILYLERFNVKLGK